MLHKVQTIWYACIGFQDLHKHCIQQADNSPVEDVAEMVGGKVSDNTSQYLLNHHNLSRPTFDTLDLENLALDLESNPYNCHLIIAQIVVSISLPLHSCNIPPVSFIFISSLPFSMVQAEVNHSGSGDDGTPTTFLAVIPLWSSTWHYSMMRHGAFWEASVKLSLRYSLTCSIRILIFILVKQLMENQCHVVLDGTKADPEMALLENMCPNNDAIAHSHWMFVQYAPSKCD
ncbi:hypothetical protein F5141DRAFT_1068114 [Pisolithus sp. B1]|nr:hypothetical protein F5141DRAFT_1068114 [Pisolithus sp. B1]